MRGQQNIKIWIPLCCHHFTGKRKGSLDLAALIWSFSKSPDAMYSGFHHTGVLCEF